MTTATVAAVLVLSHSNHLCVLYLSPWQIWKDIPSGRGCCSSGPSSDTVHQWCAPFGGKPDLHGERWLSACCPIIRPLGPKLSLLPVRGFMSCPLRGGGAVPRTLSGLGRGGKRGRVSPSDTPLSNDLMLPCQPPCYLILPVWHRNTN